MQLSTFAATRWELQPAHPDAHAAACIISCSSFPTGLVLAFKAFALAVLDHTRGLTPDGGQQHERHAAVTTLRLWLRDLSVFAHWMHQHHLDHICDVTGRDLAGYLAHVRALHGYPWGAQSCSALAEAPGPGRYNKTPRIAVATMEALLGWALRMLEDVGPDTRDAWTEHRMLRRGTHPSQRRYDGLSPTDRLHLFRATDGTTLPVDPRDAAKVNWTYRATLVGLHPNAINGNPALKTATERWGLPLAAPSVGTITGMITGQPWREAPIRTDELGELTRHLATACFVTISYLSGMRPGEKHAELHLMQHSSWRNTCPVSPKVASVRVRLRVILRGSVLLCESLPGFS